MKTSVSPGVSFNTLSNFKHMKISFHSKIAIIVFRKYIFGSTTSPSLEAIGFLHDAPKS